MADAMQKYWEQGAKADPYTAVVTKAAPAKDDYYAAGAQDIAQILQPFLKKHNLPTGEAATIIDVGCGTGRMTVHLPRMFGRVIGTDIAASMIQAAQQDDPSGKIEYLVTSGYDLAPLPGSIADVVISFATYQHVNSKTGVTKNLEAVWQVLKPGGWTKFELRGEPGNPPGALMWFKGFNRWCIGLAIWRKLIPIPFIRIYNPLYGACFKEAELARLLKKIGFVNIEVYTQGGRHLWAEARKPSL